MASHGSTCNTCLCQKRQVKDWAPSGHNKAGSFSNFKTCGKVCPGCHYRQTSQWGRHCRAAPLGKLPTSRSGRRHPGCNQTMTGQTPETATCADTGTNSDTDIAGARTGSSNDIAGTSRNTGTFLTGASTSTSNTSSPCGRGRARLRRLSGYDCPINVIIIMYFEFCRRNQKVA